LKKIFNNYGFLFGIALVIVIIDQWTKWLVRTHLALGEIWAPWPWLLPYARIVHWSNTGAAFGMFQQSGDIFRLLAILVSLAIIYYFPRVPKSEWPLRLAMGLQLGGAVGNLIDRLLQGQVTDFISVMNFAVFNVADACISIGVVVLLIGVWINERQAQKKVPEPELADPESPAGQIEAPFSPPNGVHPRPAPSSEEKRSG